MGLVPAALRGAAAGAAGTAVMAATTALEKRLRGPMDHPLDYDSSDAPIRAVDKLLGLPPGFGVDSTLFAGTLFWGYGTSAGTVRAGLGALGLPGWRGDLAFFGLTWGAALVLFPLLGDTPPVRRWPRDVALTTFAQHAVYAAATGAAWRRIRPA